MVTCRSRVRARLHVNPGLELGLHVELGYM